MMGAFPRLHAAWATGRVVQTARCTFPLTLALSLGGERGPDRSRDARMSNGPGAMYGGATVASCRFRRFTC